MDGESGLLFFGITFSFETSVHAGVSTTVNRIHQVIPESAFADAVNDYIADDETDDEGDMILAE